MSQAQIGALRVSLGLDTAQFQAGAQKAQSTLGGLTSSLKAFAVGAVGALSMGAVVAGLRSAVDHMDTLSKSAQKIGIPVAELSKLEYAARLSDVSLGDLESTLARFSKSLGEIAGGGKNDAGAALRALGISATDASGRIRPTIDLMSDIAEEFSVMQDGAGKTALAIALFGRAGASMIPLLNGGREAIAGAGEELRQFGGVASEEAAVAAEEFNDNLTRLKTAAEGVSTQVATALLPGMVSLTDAMVDFAKEGTVAQQVADAISFVMTEAAKGAIFLSQAWTEIAELANFLADAFGRLANGDFEGMSEAWAASQERVRQALEKNLDLIQQINGTGQTVAPGKGDLPSARRTNPAPVMPAASLAAVAKTVKTDVDAATKSVQQFQVAFETATPAADEFRATMEGITGTVVDGLSSALTGLVDGTMKVEDAFAQMARSLLDDLSSIAMGFLKSGLMSLLFGNGVAPSQAVGQGLFGGFRANGGPVSFGKSYIVGEEGPELFSPGASGHITPNDMMGGRGGGATVNVYNQAGDATVEQKQRRNSDGSMTVDVWFKKKMEQHGPDVNRRAIPGGFGIPPSLINR